MDVCITEFNKKAYADSIRKKGRAEERALFAKVIDRVKKGILQSRLLQVEHQKKLLTLL